MSFAKRVCAMPTGVILNKLPMPQQKHLLVAEQFPEQIKQLII